MPKFVFIFVVCAVLSSCHDPFYVDYPNLDSVKGPRASTLDSLPVSINLSAKVNHAEKGLSPIVLPHHLLFKTDNADAYYQLDGATTLKITPPLKTKYFGDYFEFGNGTLGYHEYTFGTTPSCIIYQFQNENWQKWAKFDNSMTLNTALENTLVLNERKSIKEDKYDYKTHVWDPQTKKIIQTIPLRLHYAAQHFFNISEGILSIYEAKQTLNAVLNQDIRSLIAYDQRATIFVSDAIVRPNGHLLLVIKDANYDGVLAEFDGSSLKKIAVVPVGNFDSARSFENLMEDKQGNIFIKVDYKFYHFSSKGQWKTVSLAGFGLKTDFYDSKLKKNQTGTLQLVHKDTVFDLVNY